MSAYVGRFAPSPTGPMHVGIARTSLAAWLDARRAEGRILLRIEDIDTGRCVDGMADEIRRDLEWLGLDWDGEITFQSKRHPVYEAAVRRLGEMTYLCTCSRREIALASAPHEGEEGPRYPGTCRDGFVDKPGRTPSIRVRTSSEPIRHEDRLFGELEQNVEEVVGDFVIRRVDGLWSYQLAVTVDDLEQGITCVVRGSDLLSSTPRQLYLRRLLGGAPLETLHVPLLRDPAGKRLATRHGAPSIRALRETADPTAVVGALAESLGLVPEGTRVSPAELVPRWNPDALVKTDQVWAWDRT